MSPFTAWEDYKAEIAEARNESTDTLPSPEDFRDEPTGRIDPSSGADGLPCPFCREPLHEGTHGRQGCGS